MVFRDATRMVTCGNAVPQTVLTMLPITLSERRLSASEAILVHHLPSSVTHASFEARDRTHAHLGCPLAHITSWSSHKPQHGTLCEVVHYWRANAAQGLHLVLVRRKEASRYAESGVWGNRK